ncbi:hypothetical protein HDU87_002789 [Geranomyces variabilis]|uniref:Uncharacterized protein n=1 Tax=Geranomyces variabilis TaxID=109894 RepID=A0AAD5XNL6_9FUNG|nr:hypothetical protein HDU87_002789 [Geranomyces variabilis]
MPELELAGVACGNILRKVQKDLKRVKHQRHLVVACVHVDNACTLQAIHPEFKDRALKNIDYTEVTPLLQMNAANML